MGQQVLFNFLSKGVCTFFDKDFSFNFFLSNSLYKSLFPCDGPSLSCDLTEFKSRDRREVSEQDESVLLLNS